jgi:hypothetical protein
VTILQLRNVYTNLIFVQTGARVLTMVVVTVLIQPTNCASVQRAIPALGVKVNHLVSKDDCSKRDFH